MKITFFIAILFISGLCLITACSTPKKSLSPTEIKALPVVLKFTKSGCRGMCPSFDLMVYENGQMIFNGKRYTKQEGEATAQLTESELAKLKVDCQKADLYACEAEYGMRIMDIPTTDIHFYEKDKDVRVRWRMHAPESVTLLNKEIMDIVYAKGWVEDPFLEKEKAVKLPMNAVDNELIVQFKNKLDAKAWCKQFEPYGMSVKKTLSTSVPIYLIGFDKEKIASTKLLELVKENEEVATAEFNQELKLRNR